MIAHMAIIIQPNLSEADMLRFIKEYSEKNKLPDELTRKLIERVNRLSSSFIEIFIPYFEEQGIVRYDAILDRMDEFIRRLKISVKNHKQDGANEYADFWQKIKRNVNKEAKENYSKALLNCCAYFSYEIDNIFEN
jgi:hypothetical protein